MNNAMNIAVNNAPNFGVTHFFDTWMAYVQYLWGPSTTLFILGSLIALEQLWALTMSFRFSDIFYKGIMEELTRGNLASACQLINSSLHPLAMMMNTVLRNRKEEPITLTGAIDESVEEALKRIHKRLVVVKNLAAGIFLMGIFMLAPYLIRFYLIVKNADDLLDAGFRLANADVLLYISAPLLTLGLAGVLFSLYAFLNSRENRVLRDYESAMDLFMERLSHVA